MDRVVDIGIPAESRTPALPARTGTPRRDLLAGALLTGAAALAVGGSFASLDRAVAHVGLGGNRTQVVETSPWYYRAGPVEPFRLDQFFGAALVVGGALALAFGLFLLTGQARRIGAVRPGGVVAAALLFGAVLATVMSVLDDLQWDELAAPGAHVTHPSAGFWLLGVAGLASLAALGFLLAGLGGAARRGAGDVVADPGAAGRGEPETPAYGMRVIAIPPGAERPPR